MGAKGCLTVLEDDNDVHILFDFGQTKIKRLVAVRRYYSGGENNVDADFFDKEFSLIKLPSIKSINMDLYVEDDSERRRQAEELHNYIVDNIVVPFFISSI